MNNSSSRGSKPHAFVPDDTYRTNPLPDQIRDWIETYTGFLQENLNEAFEYDDFDIHEAETHALDAAVNNGGKWWTSQSERAVVGLGETLNGSRIYNGQHVSVVVKMNALLRNHEPKYDTPVAAGNLAELQVWKYVVDNGYDKLFGTILDYADDGSWIAMKEYMPYYPHGSPDQHVDYISGREAEYDYGRVLRGLLIDMETGIDVHVKDGNVGLERLGDGGYRPVAIDYGAHTEVEALDWRPSYDSL